MDYETTTETEGDRKRKADAITPADNVAEAAEAPVVIGGGVEEEAVSAPALPNDVGDQEPLSTANILVNPTKHDDSSMQFDKDPKASDVKQEEEAEAPRAQNSAEKAEETAILPPGATGATEEEAAVSNAPADVATPIDTSDEPPAQSVDKDETMKLGDEIDEENGRAEASMEVAVDEATQETAAKPNSPSEDSEAAPVAGSDTSTPPIPSSDLPNQQAPPQVPATSGDANVNNAMKLSKADGLVNDRSDPSYKSVRYAIIENDASPAALIKLVGLKSLFAKQLPKMPRAYIARLVFDRRHVSLAILSSDPTVRDTDEEIIGAICYRPFHEQRFAEIAFCAVNGNHQVKGYGTKLMILLKQHAARDGIRYLITYADNFAIGYFKKQGFTKAITMPKGRYHGLIKDYDGGTPMECYIHPSIDFTRIEEMVEAQRKFILDRIALTAKSATVVYPPVRKLHVEESPLSRSNPSIARALSIPGVAEAGWTVADLMPDASTGREGSLSAAALKTELLDAIRKISEQQYAWPFREPVNVEEVPDYLDIIKNPIDLKTMERKAKQDAYKSKQMLFNDVMLMCDNCRVFNEDGSQYTQCANKVERYTRNLLPECTRKTPKK